MVLLSHLYMTTGKTIALTIRTFVAKWCLCYLICSLGYQSFSSKEQESSNFMTAVTVHSDFGAQESKICHCFHFFPFDLPWSDIILILKYRIAKNHYHLRLHGVIILLMEGLAPMLMTAEWSWWCFWQFLKIRQQWSVLHWLGLPPTADFSVAYSAVRQHFTHSRATLRVGVSPLKPLCCFINTVYGTV